MHLRDVSTVMISAIAGLLLGWFVRGVTSNPHLSLHLEAQAAEENKLMPRILAQPHWPETATISEIYDAIAPANDGDTSLCVNLVKQGFLERSDLSPQRATEILQYALDEDPDGVIQYLLDRLGTGKLDVLMKTVPLPPAAHPGFTKLLLAYADYFGPKWGDKIPYSLSRIRTMSRVVTHKTFEALSKGNTESLRLCAHLFPAYVSEQPAIFQSVLDATTNPRSRLIILGQALGNSLIDKRAIAKNCISSAERLMARIGAGTSDGQTPLGSHDDSDVELVLAALGASRRSYTTISESGNSELNNLLKIGIIREMVADNLVDATRLLASDPAPPDAAIELAVEAMIDDSEAARQWASKIIDPRVRLRVNNKLNQITDEDPYHE